MSEVDEVKPQESVQESLRQVIAWLDQERTGHEPPAAPSPSPSPAVSPIDITGRVRRVEPGGL